MNKNLVRKTLGILLLWSTVAPAAQAEVFNRIGGDGGEKSHNVSCPTGQFATAIRTYDDGNVISQIQLRCSRVNQATGAWEDVALWTSRSPTDRIGGSSGLRRRTVQCPRDEFLGPDFKGHVGRLVLHEVVSGLRVQCVRYRNIDTATGEAERRLGPVRQLGARFSGASHTSRGSSRLTGDSALTRVSVKYGHAIDSLRVDDGLMPWYQPPRNAGTVTPSRPPSTGRRSGRSRNSSTRRADLQANMTSLLWRYSTTTVYRGQRYRRVPDVFCASGMTRSRGGLGSTKQFTLPALTFDIVNAGTNTALQSAVEIRFGDDTYTRSVAAIAAGARVSETVRRSPVRRCVTTAPGGCFECAGSTSYQDPQLTITVDSTNAVSESNENNNQLSR